MKTNKFGASAAVVAAVFCACDVQAVDWPAAGGTYTVPADTTVEVGVDDFAAVNALSKIVLANSNSVMRFMTSSYPSGPSFEGAGTVLFAEELAASQTIAIKRGLSDAASGNFLTFDFAGGIDTNGTKSSSFSPSVLSNATLRYHGANSLFNWRADFNNARFDLDETISISNLFATGSSNNEGYFGIVRQRGGSVKNMGPNDPLIGRQKSCAAWLLEGGSLVIQPKNNRWYAYGRYIHFRQTGGLFDLNCWQRPESQNDEYTIPSDFIYGGTAVATAGFENSTPSFSGSLNVVVMGDAYVNAKHMPNMDNLGYRRMVALNGGLLQMNSRASESRSPVYYSFNGGTLRAQLYGSSVFGCTTAAIVGSVRVYEKGGAVQHFPTRSSDGARYCYLPEIREAEGNVVKSVAMTPELANRVWQLPPSVEITDSTGEGSNAVAVVDYDFDSGKVTNITVVSGGENYTDGKVTANLRYKAGEELLETSLPCTVGPSFGGDFSFGATNAGTFRVSCTNTYRGATIIDSDMAGEVDYRTSGHTEWEGAFVVANNQGYFPNSTSIVVKSGCLWPVDRDPMYSFPSCTRLELYGGHLEQRLFSFKDTVVGGETWLCSHAIGRTSHLQIPAEGTLTVDFGAVKTNGVPVTPTLKYGQASFVAGSSIVLKNWDSLPRGRKVAVLDMSEVETRTDFGLVTIVQNSDEGVLSWDSANGVLYAKRHADGFFLLFR